MNIMLLTTIENNIYLSCFFFLKEIWSENVTGMNNKMKNKNILSLEKQTKHFNYFPSQINLSNSLLEEEEEQEEEEEEQEEQEEETSINTRKGIY